MNSKWKAEIMVKATAGHKARLQAGQGPSAPRPVMVWPPKLKLI